MRSVYVVGENDFGQLGVSPSLLERSRDSIRLSLDPALADTGRDPHVVEICCGADFSLARTAGGDVYGWGCCKSGQLGMGTDGASPLSPAATVRKLPLPKTAQPAASISAGFAHAVVVDQAGAVFCAGSNRHGQCGRPSSEAEVQWSFLPVEFVLVPVAWLPQPASAQSPGMTADAATVVDAEALASLADQWPTVPPESPRFLRTRVSGIGLRFVSVRCGWNHTALLSDAGDTFLMGWNAHYPVLLRMEEPVSSISTGSWNVFLVGRLSQRLFVFGMNSDGQLMTGGTHPVRRPTAAASGICSNAGCKGVAAVSHGATSHAAVACSCGSVYVAGKADVSNGAFVGLLGLGSTEESTSVPTLLPICRADGLPPNEPCAESTVTSIECGWECTFVLQGNGQVWFFGSNVYGQGFSAAPVVHATPCLLNQHLPWLQGKRVLAAAAGRAHAVLLVDA